MEEIEADQVDKYLLDEEIGRGMMGVVYRATHEFTQRTVALKILSAEVADSEMGAERFRREVSVSARVDDEGIIEVYDAGRFEETFYYAMELLEGNELEEVMDQLPLADALGHVADAAETLAACHDAGVVHRDLKPANIFLPDEGPGTKILDFGVASVRDAARATEAGFTLGTPYYMSPEQARDARAAEPQSDVWSLGVITYELVTGELPFSGGSAMSVMMSVVEDPPRPMPDVEELPDELPGIVRRSLHKDPADRFQDAREFAAALRGVELPSERRAQSYPPGDAEASAVADTAAPGTGGGGAPVEESSESRGSAPADGGDVGTLETISSATDFPALPIAGVLALLLVGGLIAVWSLGGDASGESDPEPSATAASEEEPSAEPESSAPEEGLSAARERIVRARATAVVGISRERAAAAAEREAGADSAAASESTAGASDDGARAAERSAGTGAARAGGGSAPSTDDSTPPESGSSDGASPSADESDDDEAEERADSEPAGDETTSPSTGSEEQDDGAAAAGASESMEEAPTEPSQESTASKDEESESGASESKTSSSEKSSEEETDDSEQEDDSERPGFIGF